ncbi:DUF3352 domain-containing protein [bacterium]|nr:DUF3352 domain-containing protein [bacterium]MBU1024641.1 DUF3352 domain-containing protein [bacterium]
MKINSSILILCIFAFALLTVSCETPPGNNSGPLKKMTPTDEYNYIMSHEFLVDSITQFSGGGFIPGVEQDDVRENIEKLLNATGYGEPVVNGKTDGNIIILEASYPVSPGFEKKAEVLSKLASSKANLTGRIRSENLIGYVKLPGLESILDAAKDYIDVMIENNEGPSGKANPMVQLYGASMLVGINLQEDLFSWMSDEMGLVSFTVEDNEGKKYASTAFALGINNKSKAMDGLNKLVQIAVKTSGIAINPEKLLTTSKYKSFDMQKFDSQSINQFDLMPDLGSGRLIPSLLYTDDFIFIGEESEVKQLADVYDAGGAQGEKATVSGEIKIDDLLRYTKRYRNAAAENMKKELAGTPEQFEEFNQQMSELENYLEGKEFGTLKFSKNFTATGIDVKLETTKTSLELVSFLKEWMQSLLDEEKIEVNSSEKDSESEEVEI